MLSTAQIKLAQTARRAAGLTDDEWRAVLESHGVDSTTKLDNKSLNQILGHLKKFGFKPRRGGVKIEAYRDKQLKLIKTLVETMGRPWPEYANAISRQICRVSHVKFLDQAQRGKLIYALKLQHRREADDEKEAANG